MFYPSTHPNTSLSIHLARSDGSRWNNGGPHAHCTNTNTIQADVHAQTSHPRGRFRTSDTYSGHTDTYSNTDRNIQTHSNNSYIFRLLEVMAEE